MRVLLLIGLISSILSCSSVPMTQPDVCYGLQGWAYEDCITRHRGPKRPELEPNRRY